MFTIGLLIPRSNRIDHFSKDYLAAFKLGLGDSCDDIEIVIEPTGFGASHTVIANAIQRLNLQYELDLLVLPLNPSQAEGLPELLDDDGVPVVLTTMGESLLPAVREHPLIYFNSFYLWVCAWHAGFQAVKHFGSKIAYACSFHDGGYSSSAALELGVRAAGGELVNIVVSRYRPNQPWPAGDIDKLAEVNIDGLLVNYSGQESELFFEALNKHALMQGTALMLMPMTATDNVLNSYGDFLEGALTISSCSRQAADVDAFEQLFQHKFSRKPVPYMLLAYELGVQLATTINKNGLALPLDLTCPYHGPRGELKLLSSDRCLDKEATRFYLQKVSAKELADVEVLSISEQCQSDIELECEKEDLRGWMNPYLIA